MRLTDVHSGKLIWAESYEPSAGELGQIEAGVARHVAEQIRAHLAAAEQAPRASH